jgi:predicted outer membrane protein
MASWKLPLFVAAIVVPIIAGFFVGGGGVGLAMGAIAVLAILLVAIAQKPDEPIASAPTADGARHVLIVAAAAVEEPGDVARMVRALGLEGTSDEGDEVRVLVPARIGFLDRWASDVEAARRSAQRQLVATVAALAKAGVVAEARVGDEDVVQAVEDQLQSYPATDVLLVDRGEDGEDEAATELSSRLEAEFHRLRLASP